jgi:hypothetical protein
MRQLGQLRPILGGRLAQLRQRARGRGDVGGHFGILERRFQWAIQQEIQEALGL